MKPDIYDKDDLRKAFEAGRSVTVLGKLGPLHKWENFDIYFDAMLSIDEKNKIPPERTTVPSLNLKKIR